MQGTEQEGTLVVFGATGTTGGHVLRQALGQGLRVRAAVRSPDKLPSELLQHESLQVVTVDVTDGDAVQRAIEGTTMVFSALGYKGRLPQPMLLPFVKQVVTSMREHGARRYVYQAASLTAQPGRPNPPHIRWLLRPLIASMVNTHGIWAEHDTVVRYLAEEAPDLEWTATRPGMLRDQESKGTLVASETRGGAVTNRDVAAFSLEALRTGAHARTAPYLRYAMR